PALTLVVHGGCVRWWNALRWATGVVRLSSTTIASGRGRPARSSKTVAILDKILRAGEGKILRKLKRIAEQVNSIEDDFTSLTDAELRALTDEYKQRYKDGESLDDLLPEAFATVREAARRVLGQRHFDVQIMGGAALHFGN